MTNAQIGRALFAASVIEHWLTAVRAEAIRRAQANQKIPGWHLGWGAKRRQWRQEQRALRWLLKQGLSIDDVQPRSMVSPAQAEDLMRHAGLWPRKARGEAKPASPLEPLIDYTIPSPRLYPDTLD